MIRSFTLRSLPLAMLALVACMQISPEPAPELPSVADLEPLPGEGPDDTIARLQGEIQRLRKELEDERQLRMRSGTHDYRIGPGDELDVSVWKNPDLSRVVTVGPGGSISLPLLNQVSAAGRTPDELRDVLLERYAEYIPSPEVTVVVRTVRSLTISVIGQVASPGRYDLQGPTTVLEALALAGGLSQFASSGGIFVLRPNGQGGTERLSFDYDDALSDDGANLNFYLRAGDILVIP